MTRLGKTLVILNLAVAVGMAIWALGLYVSQRPPESEAGARTAAASKKGNRTQNEVMDRQAQVAALQKTLNTAPQRWEDPRNRLLVLEQAYYANPPWYNAQLNALETSDERQNLAAVRYNQGNVVLDPASYGRPAMVPAIYPPLTPEERQQNKAGETLKGSGYYRAKINDESAALHKASEEVKKLYEDDQKLTDQLAGPAGKPEEGLWARLHLEDHKHKQLQAEADDLGDAWTKVQVDATSLLSRRAQMEDRQAELEKTISTPTSRP